MVRRPFFVSLVLLACVLAPGVRADPFDPQAQIRPFAVRDTQEARIVLERARAALSEGKVQLALQDLQYVLDELEHDYYLDTTASQPASVLWRAAAAEARTILGSLPPEGRATYERITAPRAAALLSRAVALGQSEVITSVLFRYGASSAGRDAAVLLARFAMEAGRFHDAAGAARRGLALHPLDLALQRLRLDAWFATGDKEALEQVTLPPDSVTSVDTKSVPLESYRQTLLATLPEKEAVPGRTEWPLWGGNVQRTLTPTTRAPDPQELRTSVITDWRLRTRDRTSSRFMREHPSQVRMREMRAFFRPLFPVASGRTVVVADGFRIRGLDVFSGAERWLFPSPQLGPDHDAPFPTYRPGRRGEGRTSLERPLTAVIHGERVLATLEEPFFYDPEKLQYVEISNYLPRRRLVCLDLATGAHLWTAGANKADAELAKMTVVAPPVVAEGVVVVLAASYEGSHNLWAYGFDLETGGRIWQRRLATGQQELNLFGIPVKELAGSSISVADGVAYAHTGLGFMAALGVRTGAPRWLASYEIQPIEPVEYWYHAPVRLPEAAPNPPRVFGDQLIVAPTDGMHVHAYDRHTGKLLWRAPYHTRSRRRSLHPTQVIGIANDGQRPVLLITDTTLRAIALEGPDRGEVVWESLDPEDPIVGQGSIAGDQVLVPTRSSLRRYSLRRQGALLAAVPWPQGAVSGNLLPLNHVLLVTSRERVQWFIDWDALDTLMAERRRQHPEDPSVLLEAAELFLGGADGVTRARALFTEAAKLATRLGDKTSLATAHHGLYRLALREGKQLEAAAPRAIKVYTEGLRWAATGAERLALRERLDALFHEDLEARATNLEAWLLDAEGVVRTFAPSPTPTHAKLVGLLRLVDVRIAQGKFVVAVALLQRVLREHPTDAIGAMTGAERAHVRLAVLLRAEGPAVYAAQERLVGPRYAKAVRSDDLEGLERLVREFPVSTVVPEARLTIARLHLRAGQVQPAIDALAQVLAHDEGGAVSLRALALLTRAYAQEGALGAARSVLARLERKPADTPLTLRGESPSTVGAFVRAERLRLRPDGTAPVAPSLLTPPLREVLFESAGDDQRGRPLVIRTPTRADGTSEPAPLAAMVASTDVYVFDLRTGKLAWRVDVGSPQRGVYIDGLLVLAIRNKLLAFREQTGEPVWTYELGGFTRELIVQDGLIHAVIYDTTRSAGATRMIALDAYRGRELWNRDLGSDSPRRLHAMGDRVVFERTRFERDRSVAHLLVVDALSGRVVHERSLPSSTDTPPIRAGGVLLYAVRKRDARSGRTRRALLGIDGRTGATLWERPTPPETPGVVTALGATGEHGVVLFSDGQVLQVALRTGEISGRTAIDTGEGNWVRPFHATRMLIEDDRLLLFPAISSTARKRGVRPALIAFDLATGKRQWSAPIEGRVDILSAHIARSGRYALSVVAYREGDVGGVQIQVLELKTGKLIQTIAPQGLAAPRMAPSALSGHGSVMVIGARGASLLRGESPSPSRR